MFFLTWHVLTPTKHTPRFLHVIRWPTQLVSQQTEQFYNIGWGEVNMWKLVGYEGGMWRRQGLREIAEERNDSGALGRSAWYTLPYKMLPQPTRSEHRLDWELCHARYQIEDLGSIQIHQWAAFQLYQDLIFSSSLFHPVSISIYAPYHEPFHFLEVILALDPFSKLPNGRVDADFSMLTDSHNRPVTCPHHFSFETSQSFSCVHHLAFNDDLLACWNRSYVCNIQGSGNTCEGPEPWLGNWS